jgi:hypothetical protein
LRPRANYRGVIPEDQLEIAQGVYEARNVLKLLQEKDAIDKAQFKEFIKRVNQAGFGGCARDGSVHPSLAAAALEQIRADIVRRAGRPLVSRYLAALGIFALIGALLGFGLVYAAIKCCPEIKGYGYVLIGAAIGAWFSVAASRWQVTFDTIADYPRYSA